VGSASRYKARADFCTEYFAVGGFEVLRPDPPALRVEEAAAGALAAGAPIVVICADDESYPDIVEPLARSLKEKRPDVIVLLAGLPAPDRADAYRAAGVEDFVHMRGNCWQMLYNLQKRTGVIA
jgi:methylmalonyl-CoA mutase